MDQDCVRHITVIHACVEFPRLKLHLSFGNFCVKISSLCIGLLLTVAHTDFHQLAKLLLTLELLPVPVAPLRSEAQTIPRSRPTIPLAVSS